MKPQNYLVKFENGCNDLRCLKIVLTDFGLVGHDTKGGTPVFASPKCYEDQRTWRADLFSLGRVFLYMTLTKKQFFRKTYYSIYSVIFIFTVKETKI